MSDKWSLGVLIGLPITGIFVIICLALIVGGILLWYDDGDSILFWIGIGCLVVVLGVFTFTFWPFKAEYHKWTATEGTVTNMNKRLIPAGEHGMQERIVVVINGRQYGCDDTRCALIEKGDQVGLRCKKEFEWGSTNGYACKFVYNKTQGQ